MNKIILKVNNENDLLYPAIGYILGLENFCICFGKTYNTNEIIDIKNKYNKSKIFVSLNRSIFNNELGEYKKVLRKLDEIGLDGIIVGDVSALTYNLKTNIILDQLHLNNSSLTVKHYSNNANGIVLSNDITLEEINKIKENNKEMIIFKQVFGLLHLSTSKRLLVSNYLEHKNINNNSNIYKIKENDKTDSYIILEDYFGTHILSSKPINLINKVNLINSDYLIFDGYLLENYNWVLDFFMKNDIKKADLINEEFDAIQGFIDKKTIYRVKNND